ncbi:endoglucanase B [Colletotrichum liriopes]|uniref:Endoglucanase B n=1 Tax=Colletotrichum liriopes TaxID=708192 RepID=A0AA37GBW0_9PEZI|nr:endoglucanase B [Colletotrichum liriopes]
MPGEEGTYHYYTSYDFIFRAWGKTVWGSDADKASLRSDLSIVQGNFTDVPLVIGEFDASPLNTEPAARTAAEINAAVVIWDNGLDHLDHGASTWRDPTSLGVLNNALKGTKNSLADSTVDATATTLSSSDYVFNKVGTAPTDQTLPWLFNGNTLTGITTNSGAALASGVDYAVTSSGITFKASFLGKYLSTSAAQGESDASVLGGRDWDAPVLRATSSKTVAGADLGIPLACKGVRVLAVVKAVRGHGVYLFDDWTQYLGPLQQARIVRQWNYDGAKVVLTATTVQAVIASGKATTFTFELYPRSSWEQRYVHSKPMSSY